MNISVEVNKFVEGEINKQKQSWKSFNNEFPHGIKPGDAIPLLPNTNQVDYYSVLGITTSASQEDINVAAKSMKSFYHPDKFTRWINKHNLKFDALLMDESRRIFQLASDAYATIGDESRRNQYDSDYCIQTIEDLSKKIYISEKERAERDIENMKIMYTDVIDSEHDVIGGGLVIIDAYYGVFPKEISPYKPIEDQAYGPYENVIVPMTCAINKSRIWIINTSKDTYQDIPSFSTGTGFYDVAPGQIKRLVVRYLFKNDHHQVVYSDDDAVSIPMRSHKISLRNDWKSKQKHIKSKTDIQKKPKKDVLFYLLCSIIGISAFSILKRIFSKK
ncbi:hypothetical protein WA158_001804 [Blastocystis sp. Blastoise]